jgi:hypothetical protein
MPHVDGPAAYKPPSPAQRRKNAIKFAAEDVARTFVDTDPSIVKARNKFMAEMTKQLKKAGTAASRSITSGVRKVRSS